MLCGGTMDMKNKVCGFRSKASIQKVATKIQRIPNIRVHSWNLHALWWWLTWVELTIVDCLAYVRSWSHYASIPDQREWLFVPNASDCFQQDRSWSAASLLSTRMLSRIDSISVVVPGRWDKSTKKRWIICLPTFSDLRYFVGMRRCLCKVQFESSNIRCG